METPDRQEKTSGEQSGEGLGGGSLFSPLVLKNNQFGSCAGALKAVGSVAATGLVFAGGFLSQPGASKAGRYLSSIPSSSYDRLARLLPAVAALPHSRKLRRL